MGIRYSYQTDAGEVFWDKFLLRAPVIGNVVVKVSVARFCRTLGTMLSSGVAILEALDICGKTSGNRVIEDAVNFLFDKGFLKVVLFLTRSQRLRFSEMVCR